MVIREEDVYKIGKFQRPHGVHGELTYSINYDIFDSIEEEECDFIICLIDGIYTPFYIEEYRVCTSKTGLIKLEDVDTAEQARRFVNLDVYFPSEYVKLPSSLADQSWHFYCGYQVVDQHKGHIGQLVALDDTTLNVILLIENEKGEEFLIPGNEKFVVKIDTEAKIMLTDLPEGLIEKL